MKPSPAATGLLIALFISATLAVHAQTPGRGAYLTFDEGAGTVADDVSDNDNKAALLGESGWTGGIVGAFSLALPGKAGSYAEIPVPVVDTTRSFTVAAWVKLNSVGGYQTFVSQDGDILSSFFLQLRDDSHWFSFTVPYAFFILPQSGFTPEVGRWYHLAGVYDAAAQTASLYVDGVLADTVYNVVSAPATGPTAIGRGKFAGNPVDFVNGAVDDVRLSQAVLTAAEILAIARIGNPALKGPQPVAPAALAIDVANPGPQVSPIRNGLMIEEINHSLDGGLYAELIRNRAFKDDAALPVYWTLVQGEGASGAMALDTAQPIPGTALTTSLRITAGPGRKHVGVANEGYWGIPVEPRETYRASFYAKADARFDGPLTVSIESSDGATVYARGRVAKLKPRWEQYSVALRTGAVQPTADARFVISASKAGTFWLNQVSLFPSTYRDRPNGNRVDLMQMMAALRPTFLRLPGGNYLEGNTIDERFQWKNTIGPLAARPGHPAPWGYRSSDGLGLLEYLQWCEDLHMQPVLGVYAGYSLNGSFVNPGPDLEPFVRDALDEIEYVIGDPNTVWGARRRADGHPAPFRLDYVEIGNEDFFDRSGSYDGRFAQFHDAIKAAYPHLKTIATAAVTSRTPDVIDEHFYATPRSLQRLAYRYDGFSRSGPKIFVGEYAAIEGRPTPNLHAALGDAAFLTGIERNADVVVMAAYAPLLVNINPGAAQWPTNLIGYDALRSYGAPSYYVQKMFARYAGDVVLPATLTAAGGSQIYQSVTRSDRTGRIYVKLVNAAAEPQPVRVSLMGAGRIAAQGKAVVLTSSDPQDTNTLSDPTKIVPVSETVSGIGHAFDYTFAPYSFTVLEIQSQ